MAGGEGCRDERRGSSASEVGTVDGTAKTKKQKPQKQQQKNNLHKQIAFVFLVPVVCSAYEYDASINLFKPT